MMPLKMAPRRWAASVIASVRAEAAINRNDMSHHGDGIARNRGPSSARIRRTCGVMVPWIVVPAMAIVRSLTVRRAAAQKANHQDVILEAAAGGYRESINT